MKKRLFALILAAVLLLTMTACGSRPDGSSREGDIQGQWRMEIPVGELLNSAFTAYTGSSVFSEEMSSSEQELAKSLAKYVDFSKFVIPMVMDFQTEGVLKLTVDSDNVKAMAEGFTQDLLNSLDKVCKDMGMGDLEDLLQKDGTTRKEVEIMLPPMMEAFMLEMEYELEETALNYRVDRDRIYLKSAESPAYNENAWIEFTLRRGELTLVEISRLKEVLAAAEAEAKGSQEWQEYRFVVDWLNDLFPMTLTAK